MQHRPFQKPENTFFADTLKIALGVFIGALAAFFAYEAINVLRLEYAAQKVMQKIEQEQKNARAEAARHQQQQREEQQAMQTAEQLAQRLERERSSRKQAAWTAFYQPSAPCRADPVTANCANEHIAAKRRFDAQYVDR